MHKTTTTKNKKPNVKEDLAGFTFTCTHGAHARIEGQNNHKKVKQEK